MSVIEKILLLRQIMLSHQIDALVIPTSDPHQNEYLSDTWKIREWLSGFTGSAGTLVITANHAGLWTDSRYFLQAEVQLEGTTIELHHMTPGKGLEYDKWLTTQLPLGSKVACDGLLFSVNQIEHIQSVLTTAGLELTFKSLDWSKIWQDRPTISQTPIFEHHVQFAGVARTEKLAIVRQQLNHQKVDGYLLSALDEIAWLFNLRGADIPCNPVFFAYAYITPTQVLLFADHQKINSELRATLEQQSIQVKDYQAFTDFIQAIPSHHQVLIDPVTTSIEISLLLKAQKVRQESFIRHLKSEKNPIEIAHIKQAMVKDGVALVKLYRWLEQTLTKRSIPESEVAAQLKHFRSQQANYHGESFDAIVGYNANGAIVHYKPESTSCANIEADGLLLIDSGGQYHDGTTDLTRTIALGKPTSVQKQDFTLVLKGHIALLTAYFPEGTNGIQLDTIARAPLWKHGFNYGHGTGHGVGFFSNVHESPPKIVPTTNGRGVTILKPGMVMSNEPGLYRKGAYGIRIENLMLCVVGETSEFGAFLKFEVLSLFPIALHLIDTAWLDDSEITWLNAYHQKVYQALLPFLDEDEVAWLAQQCSTLKK
ncbi:MAG: aminopeptidase P family protein [Saprospiraceae bacterium]|nr:aminopeptidase P family protein [Saprospiraceae bacterium]